MSDDLFREVEEEVRKERYEQIWQSYGNYIIAGAIALVLGVAGWQAWQAYQLRQREDASARFEAAVDQAQTGDLAGAETVFRAMLTDAGPRAIAASPSSALPRSSWRRTSVTKPSQACAS